MSVKATTNVSCQLDFRRFVSCQLKFWPFVSCQLTPSIPSDKATVCSLRLLDRSLTTENYLTIILRNRAEYHLIRSRRGRWPSWLNHGIFHKIEKDICFIIQQIPIDYGSMMKTLKASNT